MENRSRKLKKEQKKLTNNLPSIFDDGDPDPLELLGNNPTSKKKQGYGTDALKKKRKIKVNRGSRDDTL